MQTGVNHKYARKVENARKVEECKLIAKREQKFKNL